ncbi:MAG: hypothetical protein GYB39_03385 [Algicola sp.]|nr:hypothetical protein [Algicola sp.]
MILKGFKEKSIKKQLNLILNASKENVENRKIKSMGVVLNADEISDFDALRSIAQAVNVKPNKLKIVAFSNIKHEGACACNICFNPKDFSWNGKITNPELETFVKTDFDVLISYYAKEVLELKYITAKSKATFKVGIFQLDERLNDLIVKTDLNQITDFKNELCKYLKVLNKLDDEQ